MTRHLRGRRNGGESSPEIGELGEIKDGNGIIHTTSRSLRKVNYAEEESGFEFMDEDEGNTDDAGVKNREPKVDQEEIYAEEEVQPPRKRLNDAEAEDESFHEDEGDDEGVDEEEESENSAEDGFYRRNDVKRRRRMTDRSFIVPDPEDEDANGAGDEDEDEDEDNVHHRSSRRRRTARAREQSETPPPRRVSRRLRSRTRMHDRGEDEYHRHREVDDEALSLEEEIRELQEDSPIREKRSLRERTKPVNYRLPPPLSEANVEDNLNRQNTSSFANPSPRRGRGGWNASQNMGPTRRLFPTGGPFGGNDVTTIFGQNTNFYNQGPQGENNKLLIDSDSSEDEILPLGATARPKTKTSKKKKPEIADLDPLGVDMNVKFADIGGLDNYIDQLKEMVALPLLYPELYQNFNITPPRGVLFHGPPGTGKTLMARALAASCSTEGNKITFFMRKGADILSKWVGEAERQLRLLFEEAKKQQPAIIFFDEIDGLAPVRSSKQEQIHASIVSTLLALMDGMDNRGQVIVIGATNRPDAVDPALRRPGRFDREFYFPLPDLASRAHILRIHTKSWKTSLSDGFVKELALLTKGYGGADLRALCTEAALLSIQRKYPQIYKSEEKLLVDPSSVKTSTGDFMLALKRIVPSSARSTGNTAQPLPESLKPLMERQLDEIKNKLQRIFPEDDNLMKSSSSLIQHYIEYEDNDKDNDNEGNGSDVSGFAHRALIDRISNSRVCNPKLLLTGPEGNGQQYISSAVLNHFEQFNVQRLDLATLVSDSGRTLESAVVQSFLEARKRQPSVIFIPNVEVWCRAVPECVILTLSTLLRSLQGDERVLLLGVSDTLHYGNLSDGPIAHLEFGKSVFKIEEPNSNQRREFFSFIAQLLRMKPTFFVTNRKRRKPLPKLPLAKDNRKPDKQPTDGDSRTSSDVLRKKLKSFQRQDMKLKNVLKIKLSGLMELFKSRYKRFRKPPVDDAFLVHLFEPQTDPNWQPAYVKDNDMILEVASGRRFYNMDLDLIEERLWNGYYSEPKQYLKDIELIYRDATTTGDRERVIKASEMFANAQMGVEEMSTADFIQECKATRQRDLERQELFLRDEEAKVEEEKLQLTKNSEDNDTAKPVDNISIVGVAAGDQLQAQLQVNKESDVDSKTVQSPDENETGEIALAANSGEEQDQPAPAENSPAEPPSRKNEMLNGGSETPQDQNEKSPDNLEAIHEDAEVDEATVEERDNCADAKETSIEIESETDEPRETRQLVVDENMLGEIVTLLVDKTRGYTISALERLYSEITYIIWSERFSWDKTSTTLKVKEYITGI